jgi:hypothetical protein
MSDQESTRTTTRPLTVSLPAQRPNYIVGSGAYSMYLRGCRQGRKDRAYGGSSTHPFHLIAQLLQLGDDTFPLVALNLDAPVLYRASRPASLLE